MIQPLILTYDYHMVKFDSSGGSLWDKIVGDDQWPIYDGQEPILCISKTELAYVGFQHYREYGFEVAVSPFVIGPCSLGLGFQTMLLIGITVVAVAAVVVVVYIKKNHR